MPLSSAAKAAFTALLLCAALLPTLTFASGYQTKAEYAILLDYETGATLFAKRADEAMGPSSMTKLMTIYIIFDRLQKGVLKLEDTLDVSERAWRKGGSKMFVRVKDEVSVEDLLRGIVIQSGNDACIVIAEGLSGSEEAFADEMNATAQRLGLSNTNFLNSTGWPEENHYMSARDIAILSGRIIRDFPEYYPYFAEQVFTYNGIRQSNRNRLLGKDVGVDGLKTGHTQDSGYGISVSGVQDGRRLVTVVNGLDSQRARENEAQRLLQYGFRQFENRHLYKKGDVVDEATVWFGQQKAVPLVVDQDVLLTINRLRKKDMEVTITYNGPIPAPVEQGAHIADLTITQPGADTITLPLHAGKDVEKLSFFSHMLHAVGYYFLN